MKGYTERIENLFTAIAFAEADESDIKRVISKKMNIKNYEERFEVIHTAITFAEAGEAETSRRITKEGLL